MTKRISILHVPIDDIGPAEAISQIANFCSSVGPSRLVTTPNPEIIVAAQEDPTFLRVLQESDLNLADGFGLKLAARLLGQKLRHRVTGTDLVDRLCDWAAENGHKVFFLGAAPGIADVAASVMRARHQGLEIAAADGGLLTKDAAGHWQINEATMLQVRAFAPIIMFVAFGHARQEAWLRENLPRLDSVKVGVGIGGAFDFWSGKVRRAPLWMRQIGLEWLWRLFREPQRFKRIFRAVIVFPWLVICSRR